MSQRSVKPALASLLSLVAMVAAPVNYPSAGEPRGAIRLGYLFTDEEGSLAVNQSTFNTYEGGSVSLEDFRHTLFGGVNLSADLRNISLNNRNLNVRAYKPGLFSLSIYNNKYRRFYNREGFDFTRRQSSGGQVWLRPSKFFKLFSEYARLDRKGTIRSLTDNQADAFDTRQDYSQTSYSLGAFGTSKHGSARVEYRHQDYTDNLAGAFDRDANSVRLTASVRPPHYEWLELSGGYYYRLDKLTSASARLETNQGWGGTRLRLPERVTFDYRFSFARTKSRSAGRETDNVINTFAIGKSWRNRMGLRVGYENRIADDLTDRTTSNGFLASGWWRLRNKIVIRGSFGTRNQNVNNGNTLVGDRSITRYRLSANWRHNAWTTVSGQWQSRTRKHEADLSVRGSFPLGQENGSRVDYDQLTARLDIAPPNYGRIILSHSYYLGKYENNSDTIGYQFSDHLFRAEIIPRPFRKVQIRLNGSYYRSRRSQNTEKFDMGFSGAYSFGQGYELEIRYDVYNFDDFLFTDRFYTGNIMRASLKKEL